MKSVKVRKIVIGEGVTKICVPIVETRAEDVFEEARRIRTLMPDVVELRADCFEGAADYESMESVLIKLREILGDIPILLTFRSMAEGGRAEIDEDSYKDINIRAIQSGLIDMVDVELFMGAGIVKSVIDVAHAEGVKAIVSNHDFSATPDKETIINRLCAMQELGADIIKIAVMPERKEDVATLIESAKEMSEKYAKCPIVAISMGDLGKISRTDCKRIGTAMTFASASKISAPGQIGIKELRELLLLSF